MTLTKKITFACFLRKVQKLISFDEHNYNISIYLIGRYYIIIVFCMNTSQLKYNVQIVQRNSRDYTIPVEQIANVSSCLPEVVVIAKWPVKYGKYFPSFSYFVTYFEIIAKYDKRGKYLLILREATCDN